jgi:antitoxin ParD1/3/4
MMMGMSTRTERATFTIPRDVLAAARERVERGEADSLSALVADALAAANRRAALREALAEALEGQPALTEAELAEARRALLGSVG